MGKEVIIEPDTETDLLDGTLVLPVGSYPYLAVVVDNHLKIKHKQKYVYAVMDFQSMIMVKEDNGTNTDTCYTA